MQRAPTIGGQAGLATAVEPTSADRLDHVGKLLAEKKPWPAFLHITARATEEWEACPTPVQEALVWMATATVGLLDTASVGPLVPVCQTFKTLIEAAEDAEESEDKLCKYDEADPLYVRALEILSATPLLCLSAKRPGGIAGRVLEGRGSVRAGDRHMGTSSRF
ncbi:hypothetical protein Esi_0016_0154 [Ectocarpus siliculosus]|uniref:Uncharacterized protein n=1 Tax=Ectocarpus siliculosus TaxID=2880 RepID=D7FLM4_ECTSI|nr:hypothetical protein Esi_0016_0154 [Ectocarpus siliculosus]|eukprot:CBJ25840.1 hypothetical protein Esi_0016_0154 [Ectocarpus siliculosus]